MTSSLLPSVATDLKLLFLGGLLSHCIVDISLMAYVAFHYLFIALTIINYLFSSFVFFIHKSGPLQPIPLGRSTRPTTLLDSVTALCIILIFNGKLQNWRLSSSQLKSWFGFVALENPIEQASYLAERKSAMEKEGSPKTTWQNKWAIHALLVVRYPSISS